MRAEETKPVSSTEQMETILHRTETARDTHNFQANTNDRHKKVIKAKERTSSKREQ